MYFSVHLFPLKPAILIQQGFRHFWTHMFKIDYKKPKMFQIHIASFSTQCFRWSSFMTHHVPIYIYISSLPKTPRFGTALHHFAWKGIATLHLHWDGGIRCRIQWSLGGCHLPLGCAEEPCGGGGLQATDHEFYCGDFAEKKGWNRDGGERDYEWSWHTVDILKWNIEVLLILFIWHEEVTHFVFNFLLLQNDLFIYSFSFNAAGSNPKTLKSILYIHN